LHTHQELRPVQATNKAITVTSPFEDVSVHRRDKGSGPIAVIKGPSGHREVYAHRSKFIVLFDVCTCVLSRCDLLDSGCGSLRKICHCAAVRTQQLRHCLTTQVAPEPLTTAGRGRNEITQVLSFLSFNTARPVSSIYWCDLLNRVFSLEGNRIWTEVR
jgi:hypothetical protein